MRNHPKISHWTLKTLKPYLMVDGGRLVGLGRVVLVDDPEGRRMRQTRRDAGTDADAALEVAAVDVDLIKIEKL